MDLALSSLFTLFCVAAEVGAYRWLASLVRRAKFVAFRIQAWTFRGTRRKTRPIAGSAGINGRPETTRRGLRRV